MEGVCMAWAGNPWDFDGCRIISLDWAEDREFVRQLLKTMTLDFGE
ncbi:MAG: hypothetical protein HOK45_02710 [Verrucomicrobia bacterium]|nr:hypothetical protein [Verrucomicrobiota bacterium]